MLISMGSTYSPLYFLASLGAGGLVVTFFMYLMFWVSHPGQPVPVFEDVATLFAAGSALQKASIAIALSGIVWFAFLLGRGGCQRKISDELMRINSQ